MLKNFEQKKKTTTKQANERCALKENSKMRPGFFEMRCLRPGDSLRITARGYFRAPFAATWVAHPVNIPCFYSTQAKTPALLPR